MHSEDNTPRFERLKDVFSKPIIILLYFINFNKFLQREEPLLPVFCEQKNSFLNKLASRFVPVEISLTFNAKERRINIQL